MKGHVLTLTAVMASLLISEAPGAAVEEKTAPWAAPAEFREVENPSPPSPESVARGKQVYEINCLSCHGPTGDGKGPVALRLGFSAGDLRDSSVMRGQTDGGIFWKITTGRDPMPAFRKKEGGLTDPEIWDVVNFVRTLAPSPGPQE